jgi:hypothetical protein
MFRFLKIANDIPSVEKDDEYFLYWSGGSYSYGGASPDTYLEYRHGTLAAGWHHIAFSAKRAGKRYLYLDGVQGASASVSDNALTTNTNALKVGWIYNDYRKGVITDVRLYNRQLIDAEIKRIAESEIMQVRH